MTEPFSVHDQPDFARTYEEDDNVTLRKGDVRALLDIATSSLDFGSGFLDNEQVECLRKVAEQIGLDPVLVTPSNFIEQYVCSVRGHLPYSYETSVGIYTRCNLCGRQL